MTYVPHAIWRALLGTLPLRVAQPILFIAAIEPLPIQHGHARSERDATSASESRFHADNCACPERRGRRRSSRHLDLPVPGDAVIT